MEDLVVAEHGRRGVGAAQRIGERTERVEAAADEDEHGRRDPEVEHLRDRDDPDPAERHEDERGQPLGRVDPGQVEHETRGSSRPDDDQDRVGERAVECEQRKGGVRAGDQQQDRRVVEPAHPRAHARRLPVDPVVQRADPEHGRQCGRVDPGRKQLATRIRDRHQHHTGDERDEERVLVEHTPQTRLRGNVHPASVPTLDDEGR